MDTRTVLRKEIKDLVTREGITRQNIKLDSIEACRKVIEKIYRDKFKKEFQIEINKLKDIIRKKDKRIEGLIEYNNYQNLIMEDMEKYIQDLIKNTYEV
ncbi:MAG: hypothetical protein MR673_06020 [Fusobacterium perfoetens]|uniref:hypothetical protein n=1 Tax=Fusobacterium perfoetens TaxID=852 RepID=UPI0023F0BC38|nr:hypothetical protein [Fusobacterium perfoetens]MCI6152671.1 hypothetical protein [Fusobacterium perfoetens]MDY3237677.1 hypothetical protein [Fusobacterium perfoetens]